MNLTLEQIVQLISIIVFVAAAIKFFVTIGEYKSIINTKIDVIEKTLKKLEENDKKLAEEDKNIRKEVEEVKTESAQNSSRFEAILIEVKTKLELLISMTGMFKVSEHKRDKD